jgi:hypothetical protein
VAITRAMTRRVRVEFMVDELWLSAIRWWHPSDGTTVFQSVQRIGWEEEWWLWSGVSGLTFVRHLWMEEIARNSGGSYQFFVIMHPHKFVGDRTTTIPAINQSLLHNSYHTI